METIHKKPTPKQRIAARKIIENLYSNAPKDLGEILENIGYSKSIASNPQMVTESIGFKKALNDLGLTDELITTALVDDIKAKPKNRIQELKLGAEILKMVKKEEEPPKLTQNTTYNFIFSKEIQEQIRISNEIIKAKLISNDSET